MEQICGTFDLRQKFSAFGFDVICADGRECEAIDCALRQAKQCARPAAVLLDTRKGQGCSFAENASFNHYMVITDEMAQEAFREIDRRLEEETAP